MATCIPCRSLVFSNWQCSGSVSFASRYWNSFAMNMKQQLSDLYQNQSKFFATQTVKRFAFLNNGEKENQRFSMERSIKHIWTERSPIHPADTRHRENRSFVFNIQDGQTDRADITCLPSSSHSLVQIVTPPVRDWLVWSSGIVFRFRHCSIKLKLDFESQRSSSNSLGFVHQYLIVFIGCIVLDSPTLFFSIICRSRRRCNNVEDARTFSDLALELNRMWSQSQQ